MLISIVLLTFASLALGVMSIYWMFSRPANTVSARLDVVDPSLTLVENNPITTMTSMAAEPINKIIPISAGDAAKLQKQLMHAGYSSPDAAMAFRAIQLLSFVAFPTAVVTTFFVLNWSLNSLLIWGMLAASLGFY